MESPVAKIIMLAATIAITAAVVAFTWRVVGENTPDPAADPAADKGQIKHENLCTAVGGTWATATKTCS